MLQALATPIIHQEIKITKTSKKGKVTESNTVLEVTGAHVLALLLGGALLSAFLHSKGLDIGDFPRLQKFIDKFRISPPRPGTVEEPPISRALYQACQKKHGTFGPLTVEQLKECGIYYK